MGLYAPFILVLVVLATWSVWWFYLAGQVRDRLDAQAQTLRNAGWTIQYKHAGLGGWPFRTRLVLTDVRVAAPSGHALSGPRLVAQANSWQPEKWVVMASDGLTLTRAEKGDVKITGVGIRASVHGLTQRWPNLAVELAQPVFTARPGAEAFPISSAKSVEFYLRPHLGPATQPGIENDVDVLFRLIEARGRTGGPVEGMARNGMLTAQIETVVEHADRLNGPDAAGVFSAWSRAGGRFTHVRGEIKAGDSAATLSSDLLFARPDGRLEGQLALKAEKPLPAIAGLARSGGGGVNQVGAAGAAAASAVTGGQGNVDLTLLFRDGRTFLGPFALAPAPRLF
ncbi:hypothetical protein BH09PSE1_BH09PSE1_04030 [soil metagenome]